MIGLGRNDVRVEEGKEKEMQQKRRKLKQKRVENIIHVAKIFGMYLRIEGIGSLENKTVKITIWALKFIQ